VPPRVVRQFLHSAKVRAASPSPRTSFVSVGDGEGDDDAADGFVGDDVGHGARAGGDADAQEQEQEEALNSCMYQEEHRRPTSTGTDGATAGAAPVQSSTGTAAGNGIPVHHLPVLLSTPTAQRPSPSRTRSPVDLDDTPPLTPRDGLLPQPLAFSEAGNGSFNFPMSAGTGAGTSGRTSGSGKAKNRVELYASPPATVAMTPPAVTATAAAATGTARGTATAAAKKDDADPLFGVTDPFDPTGTDGWPDDPFLELQQSRSTTPKQPQPQKQKMGQKHQHQHQHQVGQTPPPSTTTSSSRPPAHPGSAPRSNMKSNKKTSKSLAAHLASPTPGTLNGGGAGGGAAAASAGGGGGGDGAAGTMSCGTTTSAGSRTPPRPPASSPAPYLSLRKTTSYHGQRTTGTQPFSSNLSVSSAPLSTAASLASLSPKSTTAASVSSRRSISIGDLAVGSNCVAGEFREIRVTLSDDYDSSSSASFDSLDGERGAGGEGSVGRPEDLAFGLDPRDVSYLDDDYDDTDETGGRPSHGYRDAGGVGRPLEGEGEDEDDYGPSPPPPPPPTRTPLPHGPREGAEHMVVLSESQKRLRVKLLTGSSSGGGGGSRLEEKFRAASSAAAAAAAADTKRHSANAFPPRDRNYCRVDVPQNISTYININNGGADVEKLSPSSMISGVTNFTATGTSDNTGSHYHARSASDVLPHLERGRVEIDRSELPSVHDRTKMFGTNSSGPGPSHQSLNADPPAEECTSSIEGNMQNGQGRRSSYHSDTNVYRREDEGPLPEPVAQYRSSWMLPNHMKAAAASSDVPPGFHVPNAGTNMSYLDKPSGIAAIPPRSTFSAPINGHLSSTDAVMDGVVERVKSSLRVSSSSPVLKESPRGNTRVPPSGEGHSEYGAATLRHRSGGIPKDEQTSTGVQGASIVFGVPDTFGSASGDNNSISQAPTIRDRAKALDQWMGGKGVAMEREVRPTAGYTNDNMYQNDYLRRTSPQVVTRKTTIANARASLSPPRPSRGGAAPVVTRRDKKAAAMKDTISPSFIASAVESWTEIDESSQSAGEQPSTRPNKQTSRTKENTPPRSTHIRAVDVPGKEGVTSLSMEKKEVMVQAVQNNNNGDDDMMFLRSWSKARGTTRKEASPDTAEPFATGTGTAVSFPSQSHPSNVSSPDSFAQVGSRSFSDEFGTELPLPGENGSRDGDVWPAPPRGTAVQASMETNTLNDPVLFDDRYPNGKMEKSSGAVEQKSRAPIGEDQEGCEWHATPGDKAVMHSAWGDIAPTSMEFGDGSDSAHAGGFEAFDDPFFKTSD